MIQQIKRPPYRTIPLAEGLKLRGVGNWRFEEKLDGEFAIEDIGDAVFVGEKMNDGRLFLFDVVEFAGKSIRHWAFRDRLKMLSDYANHLGYLMPACGTGGEFLEAVLARGGEGIVIKDLDAPYGAEWIKCKRMETWDLIIVEKAAGKSSVRLSNAQGEDFGWCPCRAAYDALHVGDVVEIAAYGRHASGKLREPRFVRVRVDKMKGNL